MWRSYCDTHFFNLYKFSMFSNLALTFYLQAMNHNQDEGIEENNFLLEFNVIQKVKIGTLVRLLERKIKLLIKKETADMPSPSLYFHLTQVLDWNIFCQPYMVSRLIEDIVVFCHLQRIDFVHAASPMALSNFNCGFVIFG